MELSTSMPIPSARPPKVIVFRVKPAKYIKPKVAMIEIGIAVAMITVLEILRKKRKRIKMARKPPIRMQLPTLLMDCLI